MFLPALAPGTFGRRVTSRMGTGSRDAGTMQECSMLAPATSTVTIIGTAIAVRIGIVDRISTAANVIVTAGRVHSEGLR